GDTSGLDLPVRDPARLERLQPEVAVLDTELAPRRATPVAAVLLAELGSAGEEHYSVVSSGVVGSVGVASTAGASVSGVVSAGAWVCSDVGSAVSGVRPRGRPPPRPGRRRRTGPSPSRSGPRRWSRWPSPSAGRPARRRRA